MSGPRHASGSSNMLFLALGLLFAAFLFILEVVIGFGRSNESKCLISAVARGPDWFNCWRTCCGACGGGKL